MPRFDKTCARAHAFGVPIASPDTPYAHALMRLLEVPSSPRFGLERMEALLHALGDPHRTMGRVLHVAGTNGKGSTCAFADAICRASGLSTGLLSSPHLTSARERIRLDFEPVSEARFVELESAVHQAAQALSDPPTFFERTVAMGFLAFAEAGVDVAVVEVGLGGRLDATNVVEPAACAVSAVGLDHQAFLGDTLEAIAREKAGIFKAGVSAVVQGQGAAEATLLEVAERVGATARAVGPDLGPHADRKLGLRGPYQRRNAALALALLDAAGLDIPPESAARGLEGARWPGRYERVVARAEVILDGAHNPHAAVALREALAHDPDLKRPVGLVVGATSGHAPEGFARALEGAPVTRVWATQPRSARAVAADTLAAPFRAVAPVTVEPDAGCALEAALDWAEAEGGTLVVTGSLYLVGDVRARLCHMPVDPALPMY